MTDEAVYRVHMWSMLEANHLGRLGVMLVTGPERLSSGEAVLEVERLDAVKTSRAYVKGNGKHALCELLSVCDAAGVAVTLVCRNELIGYYEECGFVAVTACNSDYTAMLRQPV